MEMPPPEARYNVRVRYYGLFRGLIKRTEEKIEVERESTVRDLLTTLASRYGDFFAANLLASDGSILPHLVIMVNGTEIKYLNGPDTRLDGEQETTMVLVAQMSGG